MRLLLYLHNGVEFSQLGNSVKGKALTNVKLYVERNVFSKAKILLQGHQVPSAFVQQG